MNTKVDLAASIELVRSNKKGDRGPVTVYLSKELFGKFKKKCGDVSASTVIESLMQSFLEVQSSRSGK